MGAPGKRSTRQVSTHGAVRTVPAQLSIEQQGEVALFRIGNDSDFPLLSLAMLHQIGRALMEAGGDRKVHGIVITGSDRAFAAGADLAEVSALTATSALPFSRAGQGLFRSLERFPKPVVAAIRGFCLGGGLDLALACHMRIAASDSVFGHPGGTLGIMTGFGGTQRLPRIVGRGRAMEMLLSGRNVTAEEAYAWGLVSRVVPPERVVAMALEAARQATAFRSPPLLSEKRRDR